MKKYLIISLIAVSILGLGAFAFQRHGTIKQPDNSVNHKLYVALGDSVAAGVGLKYNSDSSACDRTNQSYPNQLAAMRQLNLKNAACSGATLPNGILGAQNVNKLTLPSQLQLLFSVTKPALISLTVGANDIQWTDLLAKCYSSVCGTEEDTAVVNSRFTSLQTNLQLVLQQIHDHFGARPPEVVVTGYHQVFPVTILNGCSDLTGIDSTELAWGRQLQSQLSQTIQQTVTGYSFAVYIPISFKGHELCTANPWVQGLTDSQPYHPTSDGQAAYASQINNALGKFK